MKPKLQVALDITDFEKAMYFGNLFQNEDIILELGTILILEQGMARLTEICKSVNNKIPILADIRIIKAGGKLSEIALKSGAKFITMMSDASEDTINSVMNVLKKYDGSEVVIEINNKFEKAKINYFKKMGIKKIIYHVSSEVNNTEWNSEKISLVEELSTLGFELFVTGGISIDEISKFKGIPIGGFIVGRTIIESEDPLQMVRKFNDEIEKNY